MGKVSSRRKISKQNIHYQIKSGKNQGKNGDNHLQNDESQNPSEKRWNEKSIFMSNFKFMN